MTAQTALKLTPAETSLIESYTASVGSLPGDESVLMARDQLIYDLRTKGLPTRRVEAWHYTDLRNLLKNVPQTSTNDVSEVAPLLEGSAVLTLRRGQSKGAEIEGAKVRSFKDSLQDGTAATQLSPMGDDDAIGRVNGGLVTDGFEISFGENAAPESPVELQVLADGGQLHSRVRVSFAKNSKVRLIERHNGGTDEGSLTSTVSDIELGDGAEVNWVILQQEADASTYLGQFKFKLGENAKLNLLIVNAGGKLVRQEIHGVTEGAGADFQLRVINLLGGESHTDVTMTLGHNVPDTTSTEVVRNIVFDRAHGVFQGQIRVAPDAQKTDARMACNSLLLSDDADFSAKPELEIFADDVQCAHGATVADIDHKQLYYLQSRGISEGKARAMLVQAFVAEVVEEIEDEKLVEALEDVIAKWLEKRSA